jgi:uncharacterized protein
MLPVICESRVYRDFHNDDDRFFTFRVTVETSDLYVKASRPLGEITERLVRMFRKHVEAAINRRPEFLSSFVPIEEDDYDFPIATRMVRASKKAGTGPMAAVAGAIAEFVGKELLQECEEVIIENGGDIFIHVNTPIVVGVLAGNSPFGNRLGIRIEPSNFCTGICTSSGKVGPSTSLGKADAATVISYDVALADAVATAMGNRIVGPDDLEKAVNWALGIPGVEGAVGIIGSTMAACGKLELVPLEE